MKRSIILLAVLLSASTANARGASAGTAAASVSTASNVGFAQGPEDRRTDGQKILRDLTKVGDDLYERFKRIRQGK
jgi:hypothetical protein